MSDVLRFKSSDFKKRLLLFRSFTSFTSAFTNLSPLTGHQPHLDTAGKRHPRAEPLPHNLEEDWRRRDGLASTAEGLGIVSGGPAAHRPCAAQPERPCRGSGQGKVDVGAMWGGGNKGTSSFSSMRGGEWCFSQFFFLVSDGGDSSSDYVM